MWSNLMGIFFWLKKDSDYLKCLKRSAELGNWFAKQQVVALNVTEEIKRTRGFVGTSFEAVKVQTSEWTSTISREILLWHDIPNLPSNFGHSRTQLEWVERKLEVYWKKNSIFWMWWLLISCLIFDSDY